MIALDTYATLVSASVVLLVGRYLVTTLKPLQAYSIPEPVIGGLLAAVVIMLLYKGGGVELRFDASLGTPLMLCFFASIGLNADLASLKRGGKPLLLLLMVVIGFLVAQNLTGVLMARLLGLDSLVGLLAGSITLSGGHGTGAAWAAVFSERYGLSGTAELAIACATFGLVLGGLLGGPVASYLATKLRDTDVPVAEMPASAFEKPEGARLITAAEMIETLALFSICLLLGTQGAALLKGSWLELPSFVCVLFVGVVLRNALHALGWYAIFDRCVSVLGNVSLALFLAMALMSLRLWFSRLRRS
jgi:glutamate:Na+ symporter, ESS family